MLRALRQWLLPPRVCRRLLGPQGHRLLRTYTHTRIVSIFIPLRQVSIVSWLLFFCSFMCLAHTHTHTQKNRKENIFFLTIHQRCARVSCNICLSSPPPPNDPLCLLADKLSFYGAVKFCLSDALQRTNWWFSVPINIPFITPHSSCFANSRMSHTQKYCSCKSKGGSSDSVTASGHRRQNTLELHGKIFHHLHHVCGSMASIFLPFGFERDAEHDMSWSNV